MGKRKARTAMVFAFALLAGHTPQALAADMIIGTGATARDQYGVGRAICRQVQQTIEGLSCEVLRIQGGDAAEPLAVLNNVRNGAIEVGLVGSDWQYYAFTASGPLKFIDVKFDTVQSLFSLHGEPFTLVARKDSGINGLDDLAGKRVNIGNPGSGQRAIMERVMQAKGWTEASFQFVDELTKGEQTLALCHNRVQAFVTTTSHPDPEIAKALKLCDAKIVEVWGSEIQKLIADNRFFAATEVQGGMYEDMATAVKTFGVKVTAVSSVDIDEETIYGLVKSVFDNLDGLKRRQRVLGNLLPGRMMTDGLSAPTHAGAQRYFREKGMM